MNFSTSPWLNVQDIEVCVPLFLAVGEESSINPHNMSVISRTGVCPLSMAILHKTPENIVWLTSGYDLKGTASIRCLKIISHSHSHSGAHSRSHSHSVSLSRSHSHSR